MGVMVMLRVVVRVVFLIHGAALTDHPLQEFPH
jgi:hypothetical protein